MVKQRDKVAMTPAEVAGMLAAHRKVYLSTLNADGSAHLVAMYYGMLGGRIAFWTYRASQKALNLARDPRISCLVEEGEQYFDLRGVQLRGVVHPVTDQDGVLAIGRLIVAGMGEAPAAGLAVPAAGLEDYVATAARKRIGYTVEPDAIISWDHRKLV